LNAAKSSHPENAEANSKQYRTHAILIEEQVRGEILKIIPKELSLTTKIKIQMATRVRF
jgi:hypothetical protein